MLHVTSFQASNQKRYHFGVTRSKMNLFCRKWRSAKGLRDTGKQTQIQTLNTRQRKRSNRRTRLREEESVERGGLKMGDG